VNSPELIAAHRAATRGVARTRFPPEPNGYLHIGHAKSMNLNFEGAFREVGLIAPDGATGDPVVAGAEFVGYETIFRYDDTNPDAESQEYIDNQAENVAWMGWRPARVTHSSDYFPQLHEAALELIRRGRAYVCHQTKAEIEASRELAAALHKPGAPSPPPALGAGAAAGAPESPFRDRPVEESLREFALMRTGAFAEGTASLRLKIDMRSVNPTVREWRESRGS
jgi:glutaminyl-tRNA synthetase